MYGEYRKHALLADEFDLESGEGEACFLGIGLGNDWPMLVVSQRFEPCVGGFDPGVLLVPVTKVLFVGAGKRLLAYSVDGSKRLWEDVANCGFWSWHQHGDYVLMSAELELAAWDVAGRKLWTTFVEPPWTYTVVNDEVHLDVMGQLSHFSLALGPIAS
jgi:hypothetical protein